MQTEVCRKGEVEQSVLTGGELESGSGVLRHKGFPEDEGLGDLGGRSIEGGRGRTPIGSALPTLLYLQRRGPPQGWELLSVSAHTLPASALSLPGNFLPVQKRGVPDLRLWALPFLSH